MIAGFLRGCSREQLCFYGGCLMQDLLNGENRVGALSLITGALQVLVEKC